MSLLGEIAYWYVVILAAGIGLGVASMFIGVALFVIRSLWLAAGKETKPEYMKLRQER